MQVQTLEIFYGVLLIVLLNFLTLFRTRFYATPPPLLWSNFLLLYSRATLLCFEKYDNLLKNVRNSLCKHWYVNKLFRTLFIFIFFSKRRRAVWEYRSDHMDHHCNGERPQISKISISHSQSVYLSECKYQKLLNSFIPIRGKAE